MMKLNTGITFFMALISGSVLAVEPIGRSLGSGIAVYPDVKAEVEHNDNIYLLENNTVDSVITRVSPGVTFKGDMPALQWQAGYRFEQAFYSEDGDDDYFDQDLNVDLDYELNSYHQIAFDAGFHDGHEARGAGSIEGGLALFLEAPDEYDEYDANLEYKYGADESLADFNAKLGSYQKRFEDNETRNGINISNADRDYDQWNALLGMDFTISPATKAVVELSNTEVSYKEDSDDFREGGTIRALAGFRWDITGKTTGEAKFGTSTRDFKNGDADSETRFSWSVDLTWKPQLQSSVAFYSAQSNDETYRVGNYIDNRYSQISWDHSFSTFIAAGLEGSLSHDDYVGSEREDDITSLSASVTYSPRIWMDVKASLKHENRDSEADNLDYSRQVFNVSVTLAL